ncbi:hypothetical protein Lalb_Chr13g0301521 [Lupinus albus]|uniref:Uncharacterized protein n=1 Tax=Lupinus albus TaxID=3870 RepID=A0A6A4PJS2_LUPAL|nr:hypothetical protein Lalb_Chr13g0301521 [Lupinus albus]
MITNTSWVILFVSFFFLILTFYTYNRNNIPLFFPTINLLSISQNLKFNPPLSPVVATANHIKKKRNSSLSRIGRELGAARAAINRAIERRNFTSEKEEIFVPTGCVYRNAYAFHQLSCLYQTLFLVIIHFLPLQILLCTKCVQIINAIKD